MSTKATPDDDREPGEGETPRINGAVQVDGSTVRIAATAAGHDAGPPIPGLEGVSWRPSYDRESVDRYLAEVEAEKERLLAEIAAAEERAEAAEARCRTGAAEQSTERDALLGTLMMAARAEVDRVDAEHRAVISAIHALAEEEASRIRVQAEADAAAVRDVVASLSSLAPATPSDELVDEPPFEDDDRGR
jgi:hypothetical protein